MLFSWSGNPDTSIDVCRWEGEDGWLNQHIFKVLPKVGIRDDFLFFVLKWLRPRFAEIARNKQTTGLGHVTIQDLKRMQVGVPSFNEQKAIVAIVGPLQSKIDLNRRMNETLETMARAIFKDWFVDFGPTRTKMEGRAPYLPPDVWSLFPDRLDDDDKPEGWRRAVLLDLCELKRGYDLPVVNRKPGTVPIVSSSGLSGYHSTAMAQAPGVVTGRYGTVGEVFFIAQPYWPLNTALYVRDFKTNQPHVVYYTLRGLDFQAYSDKGAVPGINRNHLHEAHVIIPPPSMQHAFETLLGPGWSLADSNNQESDALATIRDFLLPRLMSGEIRIKDAEKVLEEVL